VNLDEFLSENGFRRIDLAKNGIGHFQTVGDLDGHPVSVLVDTGAAATVVSLGLARELGLELEKLPNTGGGAGGVSLEIFQVRDATLKLGDLTPRVRQLIAMDFDHINQGLACKGCDPVDAILGVDVFETQSAVIDYGSSSLFLKE
jgi:aspartyl protease family protein